MNDNKIKLLDRNIGWENKVYCCMFVPWVCSGNLKVSIGNWISNGESIIGWNKGYQKEEKKIYDDEMLIGIKSYELDYKV